MCSPACSGVRLRLFGLITQPADDGNTVVTEDHEAVVHVTHEPRELQLEDAIEGGDDLFGLGIGECVAHDRLRDQTTQEGIVLFAA